MPPLDRSAKARTRRGLLGPIGLLAVVCSAILPSTTPLVAQDAKLIITVFDEKTGESIKDLQDRNFQIIDDKTRLTITSVAYKEELVDIMLLIDTSLVGEMVRPLAAAFVKQKGDEVTILFHGPGTRWLGELGSPEHPAHGLFQTVKDSVAGASHGCAVAFGATDVVEKSGFDLISENPVPRTPGLPSLQKLASDGYVVLTF